MVGSRFLTAGCGTEMDKVPDINPRVIDDYNAIVRATYSITAT